MVYETRKPVETEVGQEFCFGINTLIWTENFFEEDLWILPRIRQLGSHAIDL